MKIEKDVHKIMLSASYKGLVILESQPKLSDMSNERYLSLKNAYFGEISELLSGYSIEKEKALEFLGKNIFPMILQIVHSMPASLPLEKNNELNKSLDDKIDELIAKTEGHFSIK